MSHRLTIAACLALPLLAGTAWAQDAPQTVGVSVEGTVVEVPVDLAAQACGVSAETLLDQWKQLDTQIATMAETSVAADATDLAPVASAEDTQKASGTGLADTASAGDAGMAGAGPGMAAAPAGSGAEAAGGGDLAAVAAAASPEASAAENPQEALDDSAAATEGTALSKAAVCEIDGQKAARLGIEAPG